MNSGSLPDFQGCTLFTVFGMSETQLAQLEVASHRDREIDLLVQVQLQPLEVGGGDPDSPAGLIPPTFPVTRARASGPGTSLFVLVCVGEGRRRTLVATTTAAPEWADPYVPRASSPGRDPASSEGPIYCCANAHCPPQSRDTPQRGRCANAHCPPQSREQETLRSEAAGLIKH